MARQAMGIPMGIKAGPHFANITCYPGKKKYTLHTRVPGLIKRFIDDIWACGMEPRGEDVYQMKYKRTSTDTKKVTFIGIQVEVREDRVYTTLYDQEYKYPYHIERYLAGDTTTPQTQLNGVHEPIDCLHAHGQLYDGF